MSLQEFERKRMNEREKGISRMRSITNYGMGIIIIAFGFFFMFPTKTTWELFHKKYDKALLKILAGTCWVYGAFRVYRGYKKDYFRD
jgi:hypothetical protein